MAASTWRSSQPILRSLSPSSSRFLNSPKTPSSSSTPSTSASPRAKTFSPDSSSAAASPSRPTRVNLCNPAPSAASAARFPLQSPTQKRTCMCSPSTHPGAFRCRLHKKIGSSSHAETPTKSGSLNIRKLAIMNSLARCRIVKGDDYVKRFFENLVLPSSQPQCNPRDFRPRRSRFAVMSRVEVS